MVTDTWLSIKILSVTVVWLILKPETPKMSCVRISVLWCRINRSVLCGSCTSGYWVQGEPRGGNWVVNMESFTLGILRENVPQSRTRENPWPGSLGLSERSFRKNPNQSRTWNWLCIGFDGLPYPFVKSGTLCEWRIIVTRHCGLEGSNRFWITCIIWGLWRVAWHVPWSMDRGELIIRIINSLSWKVFRGYSCHGQLDIGPRGSHTLERCIRQ